MFLQDVVGGVREPGGFDAALALQALGHPPRQLRLRPGRPQRQPSSQGPLAVQSG